MREQTSTAVSKSNNRLADSMLSFSLGIVVFYWMFSAFLRFVAAPEAAIQTIFFNNQFDLYEKLVVSILFIVFGSHVHVNIKKRRQAESNLEESEDKYRKILESIEEGYYEINLHGELTFFNRSMARILTRKKRDIIGTNICQYLKEENIEPFKELLAETRLDKKHTATFESEFLISGGGRKIIELSISLIKNSSLAPQGMRGICRDITEKRMLEINLLESLENVKEARSGVILGLAKLAEYRDTDTGSHLERIREFSKVIALSLANLPQYKDYITDEYVEDIYQSSILHDIGKVGITDNILLKPGKLTDEEFTEMKKHSLLGGRALSSIDKQFKDQSFLTIAKEIAYYHHERWNGKGYPSQLQGNDIPLSARIVAIADVYDALTSKRCYKDDFSHEKSREIIIAERGELFDPEIVDAFLTNEKKFQQIRKELHKNDE